MIRHFLGFDDYRKSIGRFSETLEENGYPTVP
jgi:hypothetical protein